jgi:hypothetical protein
LGNFDKREKAGRFNWKVLSSVALPTCVNLAGKVERRKRPRRISTENGILYLIGSETCMQY